jgi:serine/threonine protein kinase
LQRRQPAQGRGLFLSEQMTERWQPVMTVLREIAAGMNYMHAKRICHGDLNPANILLKVNMPFLDRTFQSIPTHPSVPRGVFCASARERRVCAALTAAADCALLTARGVVA